MEEEEKVVKGVKVTPTATPFTTVLLREAPGEVVAAPEAEAVLEE